MPRRSHRTRDELELVAVLGVQADELSIVGLGPSQVFGSLELRFGIARNC